MNLTLSYGCALKFYVMVCHASPLDLRDSEQGL